LILLECQVPYVSAGYLSQCHGLPSAVLAGECLFGIGFEKALEQDTTFEKVRYESFSQHLGNWNI
jgi:hypothetical protein